MRLRSAFCAATALALTAYGQATDTTTTGDDSQAPVDLAAQTREIALSSIIIDTHIDVPYRIVDEWEDVTTATEGGDYDHPLAVEASADKTG